MKRLNKTTIALVTAGALGLGGVPLAEAQDARNSEGVERATDAANDANAEDIFGSNPAPSEDWVDPSLDPGPHPTGLNEQDGPEATVGETATEGAEWVSESAPANPPRETDINNLSGSAEPTQLNSWDRPKTTGTVTETLRPTTPAPEKETNTTAIVLGTLGAIVGLGLIIGGVKYFVNKDGDLVQDPNRVNEPATPEEKAASDKVKQENGEEIAQQLKANGGSADAAAPGAPGAPADAGSAATGERGMAASTGVTQMPAGVIALLILSVIGAAGYAFTRRQTV